jgi:LysM repeat protein
MPQPLECVNCGARLSPNDGACSLCGMQVRDGRNQRICPSCGSPVAQMARTCMMCDTPLDQAGVPGVLRGVSWPWIAAVAVLVGMLGLGWGWWRALPNSRSGPDALPAPVATPTSYALMTPTPATSAAAPAPSPTTPTATPTPLVHVVKSGETLLAIAYYYGTDLDSIMKANDLDQESARRLRVGQEIIIPAVGPTAAGVPDGNAPPPVLIHTVQAGDTLISIALKYDTDLGSITAANPGMNPDLIYVGQEIVVPLQPPTATPTITLTPTPTDTPAPPYRTPDLLYPVDGQVFEGQEAVILLSWTAVDILRSEQAYLVEVDVPGHLAPVRHTTQSTSWRLPPDLWPVGAQRACRWRVTVVEETGTPPEWTPISSPAKTRAFEWR